MAQYGRVHSLTLDQGHQFGRVHELKLEGTLGPNHGRVHELKLIGAAVTNVECGQWVALPAAPSGGTWNQDPSDEFTVIFSDGGHTAFWAPMYYDGLNVRFNSTVGGSILRYHVYAHTINAHNATEGWYPIDRRTLST